ACGCRKAGSGRGLSTPSTRGRQLIESTSRMGRSEEGESHTPDARTAAAEWLGVPGDWMVRVPERVIGAILARAANSPARPDPIYHELIEHVQGSMSTLKEPRMSTHSLVCPTEERSSSGSVASYTEPSWWAVRWPYSYRMSMTSRLSTTSWDTPPAMQFYARLRPACEERCARVTKLVAGAETSSSSSVPVPALTPSPASPPMS